MQHSSNEACCSTPADSQQSQQQSQHGNDDQAQQAHHLEPSRLPTVATSLSSPSSSSTTAAAVPPFTSNTPFRQALQLPHVRGGSGGSGSYAAAVTLNASDTSDGAAPPRLRQVNTSSASASLRSASSNKVWGWLDPGNRVLSHVVLSGSGVAIGRGREAFEAFKQRCLDDIANPPIAPRGSPTSIANVSKLLKSVQATSLGFVEVPDGRVSRIHCIILNRTPDVDSGDVLLEDCSSNGTFVNGVVVGRGNHVVLRDGDRISLVLSVAPLVEQFYTYHAGEALGYATTDERSWSNNEPLSLQPHARRESRSGLEASNSASAAVALALDDPLVRMSTSRYTTAAAFTVDDMKCAICLSTLRACVAIEPCGHNFCAACLSNHFASQLQHGLPLACPNRCMPPERIIINHSVRGLIEQAAVSGTRCSVGITPFSSELLPQSSDAMAQLWRGDGASPPQHSTRNNRTSIDVSQHGDDDDDGAMEMSVLCPLNDDDLPLDAAGLKSKQVEAAVKALKASNSSVDRVLSSLEALARLSWSDDQVRDELAMLGAVEAIVAVMQQHSSEAGVQCNACLAMMALVRGEGDICQANQWRIAKAGGCEAIAAAMRGFAAQPMVQLSALLAIIPLALENIMLQAHLCQLTLQEVVAAMRNHADSADIQSKALVVLGVLAQGEDVTHDAIRMRQIKSGVVARVVATLKRYGSEHDEVLWAALFMLALLMREGRTCHPAAVRAVAVSGALPVLTKALRSHQARMSEDGHETDEMILTAGEYIANMLVPIDAEIARERMSQLYTIAAATLVVSAAAFAYFRFRYRR